MENESLTSDLFFHAFRTALAFVFFKRSSFLLCSSSIQLDILLRRGSLSQRLLLCLPPHVDIAHIACPTSIDLKVLAIALCRVSDLCSRSDINIKSGAGEAETETEGETEGEGQRGRKCERAEVIGATGHTVEEQRHGN